MVVVVQEQPDCAPPPPPTPAPPEQPPDVATKSVYTKAAESAGFRRNSVAKMFGNLTLPPPLYNMYGRMLPYPQDYHNILSRDRGIMNEQHDALVFDAIGGIAAMQTWPDYTRPATIAHLTGLPVQAVGIIISRLTGASRIRDKGYQTTVLIGAYRERLEKANLERERLERERLEREHQMQEIQDEIARVHADRLAIESDTHRIQRDIREINKAIAADSETLTKEKASRKAAKAKRKTERRMMTERVEAREKARLETQRRQLAEQP